RQSRLDLPYGRSHSAVTGLAGILGFCRAAVRGRSAINLLHPRRVLVVALIFRHGPGVAVDGIVLLDVGASKFRLEFVAANRDDLDNRRAFRQLDMRARLESKYGGDIDFAVEVVRLDKTR